MLWAGHCIQLAGCLSVCSSGDCCSILWRVSVVGGEECFRQAATPFSNSFFIFFLYQSSLYCLVVASSLPHSFICWILLSLCYILATGNNCFGCFETGASDIISVTTNCELPLHWAGYTYWCRVIASRNLEGNLSQTKPIKIVLDANNCFFEAVDFEVLCF